MGRQQRSAGLLSPEIEYLRELWQRQEWSKLLDSTKSLLMRGGWTVEELAYLNYYACRGRFGEGEFYAGLPSGELARRLAEDVGAWDLLANIHITLSAGYHWVMQYERSLEHAFAFLEKLPRFSAVREREGEAWIRVGMGYEGLGKHREAFLAYERAHKLLKQLGRWHWAYAAIRLATRLLYDDNPEAIPEMMAEQMRLRRLDPTNKYIRALLYLERARYALHQGEHARCLWLASHCIRRAVDAYQVFEAHLEIAKCHRAMGNFASAMHHVHQARATALGRKMYAEEYKAVELLYDLIKEQGRVTSEWTLHPGWPAQGAPIHPELENRSEGND